MSDKGHSGRTRLSASACRSYSYGRFSSLIMLERSSIVNCGRAKKPKDRALGFGDLNAEILCALWRCLVERLVQLVAVHHFNQFRALLGDPHPDFAEGGRSQRPVVVLPWVPGVFGGHRSGLLT
jgi:hypothetical protein